MAALFAAWPLAMVLPTELGWENGLLETLELVPLVLGGIGALLFFRSTTRPVSMLAVCAMLFWIIAIARELSWGAVFLPPLRIDAKGPFYTSQALWYKPAVYPVVALLLAAALMLMVRFRLWRTLAAGMPRGQRPWVEVLVMVVAAGLATWAEKHGPIAANWLGDQYQVMEECMELVSFWALVMVQHRLFTNIGLVSRP